jgi:drug/metabolite transporter (DMT)-like permease
MELLSKDKYNHRLGLILAFGSLLWGGTYNALAKGLTPFLSPMSLLILSESLTALFIALTFGVVPLVRELAKMDRKTIRMSIIVGLLNSALAPLLWFAGLARTSAGNASLLGSSEMLCVLLLGSWLLRERITRMQGIGALVVITGVMVINLSSVGEAFGVHIGDLLVVLGTIVSGAGAVLFKKYLSHVMPELSIIIRNFAGIIAVLILGVFLDHWLVAEVQALPLQKVILLVVFTFFSRYLNLTFFYEALDRLPVTTISLIEIASPLTGLMFAFLILGERISSAQMLGGIFIVFGLLLEQVSKQSIENVRSHSIFTRILHIRRGVAASEPLAVGILPRNA